MLSGLDEKVGVFEQPMAIRPSMWGLLVPFVKCNNGGPASLLVLET